MGGAHGVESGGQQKLDAPFFRPVESRRSQGALVVMETATIELLWCSR